MKLIQITTLTFLVIILLHAGCDNILDVSPTEAIAIDDFFSSEAEARQAINATYASLQDLAFYAEGYPKIVEGASGDMILDNTDDLEFVSYTWNATNSRFDRLWQESYEGIFRANLVLQHVPEIEGMDQGAKDVMLAEARFLRALYYWHLMNIFGEVPLVLAANPTEPSEAALPKSSSPELIEQMVADLTVAIENLPRQHDASNLGRATEGAAKALLGKVYLYSASPIFGGNPQGYELAAAQFADVINNYDYQFVDYSDLWVVDNNPEQIFEVQYANLGGSIWTGTDNRNANETQIRPALNLPNGRGGNGNLVPTQDFVDEFLVEPYTGPDPESIYNGADPRLYWTVWREGDFFDEIEPVYQSTWTPTGYALKKGLFPVTDRNEDGDDRNIPIIRLGDVYLMYAEALNAQPARNAQGAVDAINAVRARVNMPTYPNSESPFSVSAASSQQEIFEAIVHERRIELGGEYARYNDLRRWQLAGEVLGPNGWQPRHTFFPIPADELDNNDQLEQNPAYVGGVAGQTS